MDATAEKIYGNRVRLRVCGMCWEKESLLMVNHQGLYNHDFWAPPGGGIEFGQTAEENLEREFLEETGLSVQIGEFLFACEFIRGALHAVELFFHVKSLSGNIMTGTDPEMGKGKQMIRDVRYLSEKTVMNMPKTHVHGIFGRVESWEKIRSLNGYLRI